MPLIPEDLKERIRAALPVADVIMADGFQLQPYGSGEWRGDCPFHPKASSSNKRHTKFHVRGDHYRCWDCGEHGDVFTWFQTHHGLEFVDAVRAAGERAGIDVDRYLRPDGEQPTDRRRLEALAYLYDLTIRAARERTLGDADARLQPLIAEGAIGWLEDADTVNRGLDALGIDRRVVAELGFRLEELSGTWILWALRRNGPIAGRPLGRPGPVFGLNGEETPAWIFAPNARRALSDEGDALLVADDELYIQLRAIGRQAVFLPISMKTVAAEPTGLPRLRSTKKPPILLTRSAVEQRKHAFELALALLPESPRLRAAEIDLPAVSSDEPLERARRAVRLACVRAGTVLDWQMALVAQYGFLADGDGRRRALRHLERIADATTSPLDRALYLDAIKSFVGLEPRIRGGRKTPSRT